MSSAPTTPPLCGADEATFWPLFSSPRLGAWTAPESTPVILPLCGLADWGLGHPLDAEENILMHVLREACRRAGPDARPLVVPPLRFVFGADPSCAFAVDAPTAHALIAEVAASVAASGFRKIVLLNSSPWNEELCAAAARDLRVSRGLHLFHIHLSALGLDLHPQRSQNRRRVQTLATFLLGARPEAGEPAAPGHAPWGSEPVSPLSGKASTVAEAQALGPAILSEAAEKLAGLFSDIRKRAPLAAKITPV